MSYLFSEPNARIFYACQGVFIKERNTHDGDDSATDGTFLTGVQSLGVNGSFPSSSLMDVGRAQKQFHYYAPQEFEITIERMIDQDSDFFYHVDPSDYMASAAGYKQSHILYEDNIGMGGGDEAGTDQSLKNYDVTILYGSDAFDRLGSGISGGGDGNKVFSVTYRNCLVTAISYTMGTDGPVTESITLATRAATYNDSHQTASAYTMPTASAAQSGDTIKREDIDLLTDGSDDPEAEIKQPLYSRLPPEILDMFSVGDEETDKLGGKFVLGITSITVDMAIEYSEVADIGRWRGSVDQGQQNCWRYVSLPVQVTCSFTGVPRKPYVRDLPNTDTTFARNYDGADPRKTDKQIRIVAAKDSNFYVWDLGQSNYLTDFSYTGADAAGGNLQLTVSYQNDMSDIVLVKDTSVRDLPKPTKPF